MKLNAVISIIHVYGPLIQHAQQTSVAQPTLQTRTSVYQLVLVELTQSHALMLMLNVIQLRPTKQVNAVLVLPAVPLPQLTS